ncbi:MAG: response regulator [Candidatus Zixiibacteriota bacterium]|nr:MAG: response regulator [candidate division Zixibacteria bacterium]
MDDIRVLVIDDEEELVTTLVERLAMRGLQADWCTSGPEALQRLEQRHYDAVVLDLKLPGISGLELQRRIQQAHPGVKTLLMTGQGGVEEELARLPGGAAPDIREVLYKPVNIQVLVDKIRTAVKG